MVHSSMPIRDVTAEKDGYSMAVEAPLSAEKRAQILRGAAIVFAEEGYEGASMARIAHEASVSKGTLYNHFESKAHLFAAFVENEIAKHLSPVFEASEEEPNPALALYNIGRRFIAIILAPTANMIYRVVVSEAERFPDLARKFYDAGPQQAICFMARWLKRQTERRLLRVEDPEFAAEQFFHLCQTRIWFRCKLGLPPDPSEELIDRVVRGAVEMFLNTYGSGMHR
jgi:TetR/AcrR family transcriptional repressor of mexJK operon